MYNEKQFIVVTNVSTTWTDDENKFTATFGKASLKLPINLCLYNCFFFNFGNFFFPTNHWNHYGFLIQHLLWQICRIKDMKKRDFQKACLCSNLFCFINLYCFVLKWSMFYKKSCRTRWVLQIFFRARALMVSISTSKAKTLRYWGKVIGSNKTKGRILKPAFQRVFQENKTRQVFRESNISYPWYEHARVETPVLRFALLPCYRSYLIREMHSLFL